MTVTVAFITWYTYIDYKVCVHCIKCVYRHICVYIYTLIYDSHYNSYRIRTRRPNTSSARVVHPVKAKEIGSSKSYQRKESEIAQLAQKLLQDPSLNTDFVKKTCLTLGQEKNGT